MADKNHTIPLEGSLSSNNNRDSAKSSHFESGRKNEKVKVGPSLIVILSVWMFSLVCLENQVLTLYWQMQNIVMGSKLLLTL